MKKSILLVLVFLGMILAFGSSALNAQASPAETARVWVEFDRGGKEAVRGALVRAGARFHYEFDELDSFVVSVPAKALNGLARNPHVVDIEADAPRYLIESVPTLAAELTDTPDSNHPGQIIPYGVDMVQARELWDEDRDGVVDDNAPSGAGVTVCIIDTGYYAGHEDLKDNDEIWINGISQVDDNFARDGYGHGSHVAGTISALNNELGVVGVTPGTVDFFIVKYFADDGLYVSGSSDLVAAIYACRDNGAKIINMSLGGSSSNRKEQKAFDSLYAAGILSIAAAGNESTSDPHYPSSYSTVMSISALDANERFADFSNFGSTIDLAAPGVDVLSTLPFIEDNSLVVDGVTYQANHIEFAGLGSANGPLVNGGLCIDPGDWTKAVVLCQRGDVSFAQKVLSVESGGGVAAVIYNNEPGNFFGTMDPDSSEIIGISLSMEDGQYLVANKLGFTADISSSYTWPASGYQAWGGTSMATPHVSGVAALLWSADPTLTNVEIWDAMTYSAKDLGDPGRDDLFGYGLVQAAEALAYLGLGEVDNPPVVEITSPADGASFDEGTRISFAATATDEDGNLSGGLVWTSNLDGQIGTGAAFSTNALSVGTHTITASVADTKGQVGSDSISVTVQSSQGGSQLVVDVQVSDTVFSDKERVSIQVHVDDDLTNHIDGAVVELTITTPKGKTSRQTATTINGTANFQYTIFLRRDGGGFYTVDATASKDGFDSGSGTNTFEAY